MGAPFTARAHAFLATTPPLSSPKTILVPCAAADVLTPRALFPHATRIVLVSREPLDGDGWDEEMRNRTVECTRVGGYMIGAQVRQLAAREGMLPLLRAFVHAAGLHVRRTVLRPHRATFDTTEGVRVEYVRADARRFLQAWTARDDCTLLIKGDEWVFTRDDAVLYSTCRVVVREGVHETAPPSHTVVVDRNLTTRFGYCTPDPTGAVTGQRDRAEYGQRMRCGRTIATATGSHHA